MREGEDAAGKGRGIRVKRNGRKDFGSGWNARAICGRRIITFNTSNDAGTILPAGSRTDILHIVFHRPRRGYKRRYCRAAGNLQYSLETRHLCDGTARL